MVGWVMGEEVLAGVGGWTGEVWKRESSQAQVMAGKVVAEGLQLEVVGGLWVLWDWVAEGKQVVEMVKRGREALWEMEEGLEMGDWIQGWKVEGCGREVGVQ